MADQTSATADGSEGLEALTEDRLQMWSGFTNATFWVVVFIVVLLIGMAVFLL